MEISYLTILWGVIYFLIFFVCLILGSRYFKTYYSYTLKDDPLLFGLGLAIVITSLFLLFFVIAVDSIFIPPAMPFSGKIDTFEAIIQNNTINGSINKIDGTISISNSNQNLVFAVAGIVIGLIAIGLTYIFDVLNRSTKLTNHNEPANHEQRDEKDHQEINFEQLIIQLKRQKLELGERELQQKNRELDLKERELQIKEQKLALIENELSLLSQIRILNEKMDSVLNEIKTAYNEEHYSKFFKILKKD